MKLSLYDYAARILFFKLRTTIFVIAVLCFASTAIFALQYQLSTSNAVRYFVGTAIQAFAFKVLVLTMLHYRYFAFTRRPFYAMTMLMGLMFLAGSFLWPVLDTLPWTA